MPSQQDINAPDSLQQAFNACEPYRAALSENCASFWRGQDKILDSMQELASGWFIRRHEATTSAIEAAQRASAARSPADAVREWQNWMTGSMQRITADSMACQKHLMTVAEYTLSAAAKASHTPDIQPPPRVTPDNNMRQWAA